jgi:acetyltransferase-like isoleucine patch superfamily enzyme
MSKLIFLIKLLSVVMPNPIKIFVYRNLFGWKIGSKVKIGLSYIDSKEVIIKDNSRIDHFNIFRNLKKLHIGSGCYIANFNEIFGALYNGEQWESAFYLDDEAMIMSHHFFDVGGLTTIGQKTVVGGRDSQFWGHTRKYDENRQPILAALDINIGESVYIGARSTLIGSTIPAGTIVGAGSVVTGKEFKLDEDTDSILIAGNPASIRKIYKNKVQTQ